MAYGDVWNWEVVIPTISNFGSVKAPTIAKRSSTSFAVSASIIIGIFCEKMIWVIRRKENIFKRID